MPLDGVFISLLFVKTNSNQRLISLIIGSSEEDLDRKMKESGQKKNVKYE
jgi:hypothetical protein